MLSATRPRAMTGGGVLPEMLLDALRRDPEALALVDESVRWTYQELVDAATSFAGALHKSGFEPGEVVLVQLPNWWESVVAAWGTWLAGGILLPVVPIYRAHELSFIVEQAEPSVIVAPQEYRGYRHVEQLGRCSVIWAERFFWWRLEAKVGCDAQRSTTSWTSGWSRTGPTTARIPTMSPSFSTRREPPRLRKACFTHIGP